VLPYSWSDQLSEPRGAWQSEPGGPSSRRPELNIVIPIKQVPETSNVKMDPETGTMIREGVESVVNPLDLYAIQVGVDLRERFGGRVSVVSMGPENAVKAIREAVAMGCDDGVLLSDSAFRGSDTWSTSYTIAQAVKRMGEPDLILCGERATDGDTGQVGPGIAAWLGLPILSYVSRISDIQGVEGGRPDGAIEVERLIEEGYQRLRAPLPAVLTVVKEIVRPGLPTLRGKKRARRLEVPVWGTENLEVEDAYLGLKGSPTRVVKIRTPKVARDGEVVSATEDHQIEEAVDGLVRFLRERKIIGGGE
jgi:electron transfer flavoprotein beta subunit